MSKRIKFLVGIVFSICLLFTILFSGCLTEHSVTTYTLEIHHLSLGQADSTLIMLPNGQTMLIDAGLPLFTNHVTGGAYVVYYIRSLGISTIDYLVVTHPHFDHIAALPSVIDAFIIHNLFMPDITHTTQAFERLLDSIERNELNIQLAHSGITIFDFYNLRADFIAPNSSGHRNLNNYSAVVRLDFNNNRFLFMGDAEAFSESEIITYVQCIAADVLMIGHHGSSTSTTRSFLQAVSPRIAIISVGYNNSYGHPHTNVLERLNYFDVEIFRTDLDGTIIVIYHNGIITVERTGRNVL